MIFFLVFGKANLFMNFHRYLILQISFSQFFKDTDQWSIKSDISNKEIVSILLYDLKKMNQNKKKTKVL